MGNRLPFPKAVYGFFVVLTIISYLVLFLQGNSLLFFVSEDHFFEYLGALAFFTSSGLLLIAFFRIRRFSNQIAYPVIKQLAYLVLAFVFFIGGGEEISWGQRILGFTIPEVLKEANLQEDATLHNLEFFNGDDALVTVERLFDLFWSGFVVVIPLVYWLFGSARRFLSRLIPVPHWSLGALFLVNYFWAKVVRSTFIVGYSSSKIAFGQAVHEVKEAMYAVLFVLVAIDLFLVVKKSESETSREFVESADGDS